MHDWNSLSFLRLALVADLFTRPPKVTLPLHKLTLNLDRIRRSLFLEPLFGTVNPLAFVHCHVIYLVLFINFSSLSSLTETGLGANLNKYLVGALYKFVISCNRN